MRATRAAATLYSLLLLGLPAFGQTLPLPAGHKMRIKIDSAPQQAAIYVNDKQFGIQGYTPATLKLPKGPYTIILELPGFKSMSRPITVVKSQTFMFPLDREAKPATLDVRSVSNDSASGGQLFVDGQQTGTVPGRVTLSPGSHLVEVKKPGFNDYREQTTVAEGETRSMVIELVPQAKKGSILVTADVAGADVYVDGVRKDAAPALIADLLEGAHTVEVRKDPLPPFKQVVNVVGNQQVKVEARIGASAAGSLRVISTTPGAQVIVDGQPVGAVNQEIPNLKPGQHIIEVRAPGFQPRTMEHTIVAGEQRVAQIDLQPGEALKNAHLRVVTPVPDAEVFIDGASVGKSPIERNDLAPGKHYVVVRKQGYAEWKREIDLAAGQTTALTAELSASGVLKVLSNVAGADVVIDGELRGKTPLTIENMPAGDHLAEVKAQNYLPAKQPFHIDGGEQKILSADLAGVRTGPGPAEMATAYKAMTSWSAVTVEPNKFTADIAGGFFPFGELRLTVGAFRKGMFGIDAGVDVRTIGYVTEGLARVKFQALRAGPVALGAFMAVGGGGGPAKRNDFVFEFGLPFSLLFADLVRFTATPYLQVYSDQNCPTAADVMKDPSLMMDEPLACQDPMVPKGSGIDGTQSPRDRFVGARVMLQAALEIVVQTHVNIFFIFEGDPVGERMQYTSRFAPGLNLSKDPQVYGRAGVTFKF
jgi:hypothetical protein